VLGGLCLLAVAVIVAIVLSIYFVNKSEEEKLDDIALDDILKGKLQPKRFNGTWIDDKSFQYFDVNVIILFNFISLLLDLFFTENLLSGRFCHLQCRF